MPGTTLPPGVVQVPLPEASRFTLTLAIAAADMATLDASREALLELPGTIQPTPLAQPVRVTLSRVTPGPPLEAEPAPLREPTPPGGVAPDGSVSPGP